jgi:hypothetical protein
VRVELGDARGGQKEEAKTAVVEQAEEHSASAGDEGEVDDVRHVAISRIDPVIDPFFAGRGENWTALLRW